MVQKPRQVISSSQTSLIFYFQELIKYRDLLITLTLRDFKVRYSQTFLGFLWAFIQPFSTLLILVFVFGKTLHVDTGGIPYPLYAMSGMVLWTYFGYVLNQSGNAIISSQSMISKVYFPRLIIPISKAFVGLIDFLISFVLLGILLVVYRYPLSVQAIYAPIFVFLAFISAIGAGILFCTLTVRYRDFQYVIPFLLQFGLYITPIAYSASYIPTKWKWLYFLNPMAGVIEGLRWSLFGKAIFEPCYFVSFGTGIMLFVVGVTSFVRIENEMADLV